MFLFFYVFIEFILGTYFSRMNLSIFFLFVVTESCTGNEFSTVSMCTIIQYRTFYLECIMKAGAYYRTLAHCVYGLSVKGTGKPSRESNGTHPGQVSNLFQG